MAFADSQANAVLAEGESPAPIVLAGTVTKGDPLGYSGGWKRALATVDSVVQIRCVAAEDGVAGQTITAYFGTVIIQGRLSGGTAGSALYVGEGSSAGLYTETAPSTTGDANTIAGYMISSTVCVVTPHANDHTVA